MVFCLAVGRVAAGAVVAVLAVKAACSSRSNGFASSRSSPARPEPNASPLRGRFARPAPTQARA
eukprot:2292256-Lingulodinium_polyedra.AAC.1